VDSQEARRAVATKVVAGAFPAVLVPAGTLSRAFSVKEAEADFTVVATDCRRISEGLPKRFTVQLESLTNLVVGRFKMTL